jgi:uncharacterized membrane protein
LLCYLLECSSFSGLAVVSAFGVATDLVSEEVIPEVLRQFGDSQYVSFSFYVSLCDDSLVKRRRPVFEGPEIAGWELA